MLQPRASNPRRRWIAPALVTLIVCLAARATPALATTKGLSQIVTPDIQDEGQLSLSLQLQDRQIGNPFELQAELGITKRFEVSVFQGLSPGEAIFGAEFGLIQAEPWLLTVGAVNWSTRGGGPQPFLESGYYTEHHKFILGAIKVGRRAQAILGYAYDFNKRWRAQVDFQSGRGNSVTAGFTCNVTDSFQFNPAVYLTNESPHQALAYVVFTYTIPLWDPKKRHVAALAVAPR
jgi:hypothetical protein